MAKKNKTTDERNCCEQVDPGEAEVQVYGDLMLQCFETAMAIIADLEKLPVSTSRKAALSSEVHTKIALALFDRSTRQMPAQDKIYGLALDYVGLLMKDKEADMKWSEEARASSRSAPGGFIPSAPPCKHEGLWLLREALMCQDELSPEGHKAIDALSVTREPGPDVDVSIRRLLCPHCLAYVLSDMVKSGHLWKEPREEKHGEPGGPSLGDTPAFMTDLEEVLVNGQPTMYIMKDGKRLEDMQVAEVIADGHFFETIWQKYGEAVYVFMLWKKDLTLYSSHEFVIQGHEAQQAEEVAKS